MESHYTNDRFDLFLTPQQLATFPELQQYCDSVPPPPEWPPLP
jgi:hypothetical protein